MKKICAVLISFFSINMYCSADEIQEVQCFFNQYINAANNYSNNYFNYYSDNAKIIRIVEKPDGSNEIVNIPIERYKSETKKSKSLAKIRKYKNKYLNVRITKHGSDYKIAAMRMPSTSDYKVPAYFIVGKDNSGNWKIKEESMNTRVQKFLKPD
ncbi:MAG: hypothetical protein LUG16_05740 [Candidatus Gastranaerophilales bacterium]|nr:hypothetical protein [Candidatus Gastranaerophilales bacterium]